MNDPNTAQQLPVELPLDPMHWADAWLKEATAAGVQRNPNCMTLSTVAASGHPSSRVVLCKGFVPDPGYVVFYTNYKSRKATELATNPQAAALLHWDALGRQVRIEGIAVRSPVAESDAYFATRDRGSQLGAWGSDQSSPIASHEALIEQIRRRAGRLGLTLDAVTQAPIGKDAPDIGRPDHWGGFRLWATTVELWIEGRNRIHDRARWQREIVRASGDKFSVTPWSGTRLQP